MNKTKKHSHNCTAHALHTYTCDEGKEYYIRRALNYALWAFENYDSVKMTFLERAEKVFYNMLKLVRNSEIEITCLFVYWILHELVYEREAIDSVRIRKGIEQLHTIISYFEFSQNMECNTCSASESIFTA